MAFRTELQNFLQGFSVLLSKNLKQSVSNMYSCQVKQHRIYNLVLSVALRVCVTLTNNVNMIY